ncbi:putative pectin lyase E [Aspergillus pseudotamarii]|uniref:pectin lyase n=1 Tax=Aspergillus pseudotamarii TaxID=132259 RepID=A0A5N6T9D4_ASPPS|nr:putative pectin lyase E [Aspergillus pseudotamarii]KAE8142978.1 putative pectin lyase E [Aspergillus pseudotamarii]
MKIAALLGLFLAATAHAQVQGTPFGFAAGTTGGGNAKAAAPSSLQELVGWLSDDVPRVILIDREWNFLGTEGTTKGKCCSTKTTTCEGGTSKGQAWIQDKCDDGTWIDCEYDNAPKKAIDVGSNKSIVGVGSKGVIRGKGLRITNGNKNVIIQNIHFTDLNPQYVWGGDAITLTGADQVWIDHNKFSLIGRQHIVSGWQPAGHVTISNNEFDGRTEWSAGCNGKHYWTLLLIGEKDYYTFAGNWVHDVSGRAPHMGTTKTNSENFFHGVNNYFQNIGGHSFDVDANTWMLLEGNVWEGVDTPITDTTLKSGAIIYNVPNTQAGRGCDGAISRSCEVNQLVKSGQFPPRTDADVLKKAAAYKASIPPTTPVADIPKNVMANAGVGKLK